MQYKLFLLHEMKTTLKGGFQDTEDINKNVTAKLNLVAMITTTEVCTVFRKM
jgi:hypothetical protein